MADHVAHRTLVKSPPEIWAEVSEQRTLASRLEAFGEIRITRLEPETSVAWEGNDVRGTVELEPTGWGTVVTLRAAIAGEPESEVTPAPAPAPEPAPEPPVPDPVVTPIRPAEPEQPGTDEPDLPPAATAVPETRRSFFARLRGRRRATPAQPATAATKEPAPEPAQAPDPLPLDAREPRAVEPEPVEPEPTPVPAPEPGPVDHILTAVLDDLGSAHHRPYSRD